MDGHKIDPGNFRVTTGFFNVTIPTNHITFWGDLPVGTFRGIADGYFLFLKPLPAGNHSIEFTAIDKFPGHITSEPKRGAIFTITVK